MAFNNEIEKLKSEIKVLEKKLSFLEEIENHKTPCEEAYKKVFGVYPKGRGNGVWTIADADSWTAFQSGYSAAQEDYKVGEYQAEELKTLYQMFYKDEWTARSCREFCDIVEKWMSQYSCDTNKWDEDYSSGWEDLMDTLKKGLR